MPRVYYARSMHLILIPFRASASCTANFSLGGGNVRARGLELTVRTCMSVASYGQR